MTPDRPILYFDLGSPYAYLACERAPSITETRPLEGLQSPLGQGNGERMKRFTLAGALAVALMGVFASASGAAPAHRNAAARTTMTTESKTPFTAAYNAAEYYGEVTCTGRHVVSRSFPKGKDIETCEAVSGTLAHMTAGKGQKEFENSSGGKVAGWNSDYNGALSTNFTYSVSKSLKRFTIVALY